LHDRSVPAKSIARNSATFREADCTPIAAAGPYAATACWRGKAAGDLPPAETLVWGGRRTTGIQAVSRKPMRRRRVTKKSCTADRAFCSLPRLRGSRDAPGPRHTGTRRDMWPWVIAALAVSLLSPSRTSMFAESADCSGAPCTRKFPSDALRRQPMDASLHEGSVQANHGPRKSATFCRAHSE
jgi:hypothetical protein